MNTMLLEMGVFNIALVITVFFQVYEDRKKYRDCRLFSRVLLATAAILLIDTTGWLIDGKPFMGQVLFTTLIDGLDLIFTTVVCWSWVQYSACIIDEKKQKSRIWYKDISTLLLLLQIVLVSCSQYFHFYYYVDSSGVYHRAAFYNIHTLISISLLGYSSFSCLWAYMKESKQERKKELLFVAFIILIPIAGNIFQSCVYGYPTVWVCMVFMVIVVYIHIQNKRVSLERKKQNMKLRQALQQAEAANVAKTDFLSRMSHDMRTPMNAIIGLSALTLDDAKNPEVVRENMGKMRQASDFMLGLINDILDMAKIEDGSVELFMEPYSYNDFLMNMKTMFKPQCEAKGITITFAETDKQIVGMTDKIRINQIFFNIFSNAIKYTPTGGKITCQIKNVTVDGKYISGDYVISDTGIGMSEEFQKHLFKPFTQEDGNVTPELQGSGLGLSITKQLVELMGGHIEIQSEKGKGTTVAVSMKFELVGSQMRTMHKEVVPSDNIDILAGKKVLLVEDHPLNAQIARMLLEKVNMAVAYAENGRLAVERFQATDEGTFDAVLMDIRMPEMSGYEATRRIRSLNREDAKTVPIIAMSANAYAEDIKKGFDCGMTDYLTKPIEPPKMYEALMKAIKNNH